MIAAILPSVALRVGHVAAPAAAADGTEFDGGGIDGGGLDAPAVEVDTDYLTAHLSDDEELAEHERRRQQINERQLETDSALVVIDGNIDYLKTRIDRLEYVMANQELVIDNARKTQRDLTAYRQNLSQDIDGVRSDIERLEQARFDQALEAYMDPNLTSLSNLHVVLTSDPFDVSTVSRRLGLISAINQQEADLVQLLQVRQLALEQNESRYRDVVAQWQQAYHEESLTTEELQANRDHYQELVAQLEEAQSRTLSEAEALAQEEATIEHEIADRNEQLVEIARQRAERREQCLQNGSEVVDDGDVITCDFLRQTEGFTGRFINPVNATVTSLFGMRVHPITHTERMHEGIDFAGPQGAPISAPAPGQVFFVGWMAGYGNTTMIDHGNGLTTLYAHQSGFTVIEGQVVNTGELIGYVGSTGNSTGPHLHFEVRLNDQAVDPSSYF